MKKTNIFLSSVLLLGLSFGTITAQDSDSGIENSPPIPLQNQPKLSKELSQKLNELPKGFEITREEREQAYAKLLEGQRYIWSMRRLRSALSVQAGARLAKDALQKAVELNPNLAEAYTALAELSLTAPPQDIDEAIMLSKIATQLDKDNFGGHRFLARLYTIKSNLGRENINDSYAKNAIAEWKEITRLDPRNAEAWGFLSAFYKQNNQTNERIDALKNWLSSATPLETGFYSRVLVQDGELTSENASLKLGEALLETGQNEEALSILTLAVSDSPENLEAVELLSQALENVKGESLGPAIEALRQAVYANPGNLSLSQILAQTLARSGKIDDAAKILTESVKKYQKEDKNTAADFQVTLADVYAESNRTNEAINSYKDALKIRGINKNEITTDDDRDFAFTVINKMVDLYKKDNRFDEAKYLIETSRSLFGDDDTSLDREYIDLLRQNGKKDEALQAIRSARVNSPFDYNLIRTEATVLTELGKVDEGVALIQNLIDKKPQNVAPSIMYDDYINYLFISSLFTQSNRGEEAIKTANKAIENSKSKERKQIAQLTLASAQQNSGDFASAEKLLREILNETPENPIALNNLGYLFLESGKNFDEALKLINKAVSIDPRNPSYLDSLGWAYYKLEKFDEAEKYLKKAIQYDAASATIYEHLGDIYFKNGKIEDAKDAWKKALRLSASTDDTQRISKKLEK